MKISSVGDSSQDISLMVLPQVFGQSGCLSVPLDISQYSAYRRLVMNRDTNTGLYWH